jgi:outer membrane protein assembly factor BamB
MPSLNRWIAAVMFGAVAAGPVSCSALSADDTAPAADAQEISGAVAAVSATDWPRFRGPTGIGSSLATELPVSWSQNENILWKTPLPGAGASSPIVYRDHIYLTAYTGYLVPGEAEGGLDHLQRHLLCLDRETGKLLWQRSVRAKLPEEEQIRDHGYAANTPTADADAVYAFFGKSGVFAYDHQGEPRWQADVGSKTSGWGTAASPVPYGDLVIINASVESESLVALDRLTGKQTWRAGGIAEAWNTPLIVTTDAGAEELVVAIHGKVLGFEPASGKQLWSCDTDITWYMVPSPVADDGVVYYLGGRSGVAVLAVRTGGRGDVTATHRLWTRNKGSNVTSPVYHDGHLYWTHEQSGIAYCARAEDGELMYEERLDRGGQFYASSLVAAGRVYHLNRDGKMFVLAARPEFEQLSVNTLSDGSQFNATPAVTGDRILIRSDRFLYCLGE